MMHHSHQLPRVSTEQEAAFAELYQRHASAIFSHLCQHTKTYEDAEDLLLEVFSSVLEEEAFFERSTAQQSGWLWRVARNKRIDAYRREQRRPALVLDLVTDSLYEDEKHEPEHIAFGAEANSTGKIFILDPASGKQLQVYSLPLELYELVPVNGHMVIGYATHNPTSISRYGNSGMLELDLTFHNRLWMDNNLNGDNAFPTSPLLDNGVLYFKAETQVEAANLATGKIFWQQDLSKQVNP